MKNAIAAFAALGMAAGATASGFNEFNLTQRLGRREMIRNRTFRHSAHMPKPEEAYRDLIKAGLVKIERRRGKPPRIIWL